MYKKFVKRFLDVFCSLLFILLFWWLFLIIALIVKLKLGSPVVFKQERPGKDEKIFCLYKFRTMTDKRDENGNLLPDGVRLTKFGRLLRATSLDELPELFNILKGDMSIVGPRPLLVSYLDYYSEDDRKRHSVRPGITGLAQVNGRNGISWGDKFRLDNGYIETLTFKNDLKILFLTVKKVLKREGIEFDSTETIMDYFEKQREIA